MTTRIDIDQLRKEIRRMKPRQKLYEALKEELTRIGHWKNKPRGKPSEGYRMRASR